ncbi:MAG: sigma-70 family RNA polymerase sigma factor [Oscillospiraceae bacterium]|nr:sigma-70 family RNA polymerase sigma factor [Oscillospiraceae bacterium]
MIGKMKNGDKNAKDLLVMSNLKLVLSIIQKVNSKNIDADDLFQVGCIGLIKALDNFDTSLNVQFSTYGVVMILGEIKRYIRDNSPIRISRSTKDLGYRALAYKEQYIKDNNCEPSRADIALQLGVSTYQVYSAMEALSPAISLYEPVFGDENEGLYLLDRIATDNFEEGFCSETVILDVLHGLKRREKYIIYLRYMLGKTQAQVAEIIGISQAQVSRIEKNVLASVKKELNA